MPAKVNIRRKTHFSLFKPKNILFLTLSLSTLLMLLRFVFAAKEKNSAELQDLNNPDSNEPLAYTMLYSTMAAMNSIFQFQSLNAADYVNEPDIKSFDDLIVVHNSSQYYSLDDQFTDKMYAIKSLQTSYSENLIDKCSLNSLMNHFPNFKMYLVPDLMAWVQKNENTALKPKTLLIQAGYYFPTRAIVFEQKLNFVAPAIFASRLSGSLSIAMNAFSNYISNFSLTIINGETVPLPQVYKDPHDMLRINATFQQDIERIYRLYHANLQTESVAASEQQELADLRGLILQTNYRHIIKCVNSAKNKNELLKYFQDKGYALDSTGVKYIPGQAIARQTYKFNHYFLEYYLEGACPLVFTLTHPKNYSISNLLTDLLTNLKYLIENIRKISLGEEFVNRMNPEFASILAPYSHVPKGAKTSLLNWLFPRSSTAIQERMPNEFKACMQQSLPPARNIR